MGRLDNILGRLPEDLDKQPGYLPYDFAAGVAIELEGIDAQLKRMADLVNVDKLSGDDLTRFVYQRRGLIRKPPSFSVGKLQVIGTGWVRQTDIFETEGGIRFKPVMDVLLNGSGLVDVIAMVGGKSGNVPAGAITKIPMTIQGIISCSNTVATTGGYETETDEQLRARYYKAVRKPPTSGNAHQYELWALEVQGVGEAQVIPRWAGKGTVKVIVLDADFGPPPSSLVNQVQNYIDPNQNGDGSGEAPIGATCTVEGAMGKELIISVKVKKQNGFSDPEVYASISGQINKYLAGIAFKQDYVSFALIGNAIATADGVADYSELLINDLAANMPLTDREVAVLKTLSIGVMA